MGSSKKHKEKDRERDKHEKEGHKRKRKHRSRSRSRDRELQRDRSDRGRKEEKKRRKERSPETYREDIPGRQKDEHGGICEPDTGGGEKLSLSIQATNKIRAKLGLKPLNVPGAGGATGSDKDDTKPSQQEDVHAPAVNISEVKKTDAMRLKMAQLREKRRINLMLGKVKRLADSESDDDTLAWVRKSRKVQEEKAKAARQAKLLEEMDAEFGIGDLVEEEFKVKNEYTSKSLKGLKVQHNLESFKEGRTTILTLEDRGVLDEEHEDTLVNVNIVDDERADKYVENKKKKPEYNPYADEYDEHGEFKPKQILDKYDEEIDGVKKKSFQLGHGGKYNAEYERRMVEMKKEAQARGETLHLPSPSLAVEFYTQQEMASFNKVKKKVRKLRKKAKGMKADDLVPLEGTALMDFGSRKRETVKTENLEEGELEADIVPEIDHTVSIPGLDLVDLAPAVREKDEEDSEDSLGPEEDLTGVPVEEDIMGLDLELALRKTRRIKQKKDHRNMDRKLADAIPQAEPEMEEVSGIPFPTDSSGKNDNIVLNATSEFCRTVGDIPTYGHAGNRPEDEDELMDFEQELVQQRQAKEAEAEEAGQLGWQSVQIDTRPVEIKAEEKAVLEEEPVVTAGLAGALALANKKGYLENEMKKSVSATRSHDMEAKNYSIEDKRYDDLDEKYRKRDRYMGGAVMDFKEKNLYKPEVHLEYIDDGGRIMNPKEAFRYLSHRFHGKGSGKRKTEKRQKKVEEEQLMKSMSSTDTPLNTVALLKEKQKSEKSPYIVLSGSAKGTTCLSK